MSTAPPLALAVKLTNRAAGDILAVAERADGSLVVILDNGIHGAPKHIFTPAQVADAAHVSTRPATNENPPRPHSRTVARRPKSQPK